MSHRPIINVVVLDTYTEEIIDDFTTTENLVKIYFNSEEMNFDPCLGHIEEKIDSKIHPLIEDLYKISLAIYLSDLMIRRDDQLLVRTISILIAVSNIERWVFFKKKLEGILSQLSGDHFTFNFVQKSQNNVNFIMRRNIDTKKVVSLFSGGLDSLAGVSWLLDREFEPILVSHGSQTKIINIQRKLADSLTNRFEGRITSIQINARTRNIEPKENSQRLRSFLYLTLGCIFALHNGIENLYMFENGVLAMNIPISNARIFLNTRTAHPTFLKMYENFIKEFFNINFNIFNPFLEFTKAEVISLLNNDNFRDLIQNTISCSQLSYLRYSGYSISEIWHCGWCYPCLIRRISMEASNLNDYDVNYAEDLSHNFNDLNEEIKNIIFELINFTNHFNNLNDINEILENFHKFYVSGFNPEPLIRMYQRFVEEARSFLSSIDGCDELFS
jgi:7-cyano-7-deazaguanine synthase in queuosine biosynthesis